VNAVPSALQVETLLLTQDWLAGEQMMGLHVPALHSPWVAAQSGPVCSQPVPPGLQVTTRVESQLSFPGSQIRGKQAPVAASQVFLSPQSVIGVSAVPASEHR
jgi:hypothetical protein